MFGSLVSQPENPVKYIVFSKYFEENYESVYDNWELNTINVRLAYWSTKNNYLFSNKTKPRVLYCVKYGC